MSHLLAAAFGAWVMFHVIALTCDFEAASLCAKKNFADGYYRPSVGVVCITEHKLQPVVEVKQ